MRILHTVEYYHPSVGGAQEVVRQVSERLVRLGHEVTVATTRLPERRSHQVEGVRIEEFQIHGNAVLGFTGETERYQQFLRSGSFDLMMNYAAQQWSTDLALPILREIPYRKVLAPCGFSGLYDPRYQSFFDQMKQWLGHYDHLVFHASNYRDIEFARQNGHTHLSVIANGASEVEFADVAKSSLEFRQHHGVPDGNRIVITVGNHTGLKGHRLAMDVIRRLKTQAVTLVILAGKNHPATFWQKVLRPLAGSVVRCRPTRFLSILKDFITGKTDYHGGCFRECQQLAAEINSELSPGKRVLLLELPRAEVVDALRSADLFFFGSNVECSPIVLFEAMAAGLPFITLGCGNSAEIVKWSEGGGILAPTVAKEGGYVDGDPEILASMVDATLADPVSLRQRGQKGHAAWKRNFTWDQIARNYERVYRELL